LFIGPVFYREASLAPRRPKTYIVRAAYSIALLVLMCTVWLVLTGTQLVCDIGDLARFGSMLFEIIAPVQLALAAFFSAILAASAVAHEKDRRTLVLLLLTRLSNSEIVLGKLLASLLSVFMMLCTAWPVFLLGSLLGGVSFPQIARVFAVTVAGVVLCGSLGSILALWREKTFQAVAMTVLTMVLWLAVWKVVAIGAFGEHILGFSCQSFATIFSPWEAIQEATKPYIASDPAFGFLGSPVYAFLCMGALFALVINGIAVFMVRVWNPSREIVLMRPQENAGEQENSVAQNNTAQSGNAPIARKTTTPGVKESRTRHVWDNPILWREIRTWAYGRKILVVRLAYLLMFALAVVSMVQMHQTGHLAQYGFWALVPLLLLSLVLVNTQAVTSLTSERDVRALDLLLVTDLSPKEIVFGKLGGIFYNTKEMVLLPLLLCVCLWLGKVLSFENLIYVVGGLAVLYFFVAMLGVHSGMIYSNSGVAVATSLGTVFFLFVGVGVCMRIMMAFNGSFEAQFLPFFAFMVLGGVGLYVVLGVRNPSPAIGWASFICPLATFYAITSFLQDWTLGVFLVSGFAYGFMTAAMLVPALCEFDVATGRASADE
jgi:ABC-type transport system involved in multi-copper enzyme maturation permease subunit